MDEALLALLAQIQALEDEGRSGAGSIYRRISDSLEDADDGIFLSLNTPADTHQLVGEVVAEAIRRDFISDTDKNQALAATIFAYRTLAGDTPEQAGEGIRQFLPPLSTAALGVRSIAQQRFTLATLFPDAITREQRQRTWEEAAIAMNHPAVQFLQDRVPTQAAGQAFLRFEQSMPALEQQLLGAEALDSFREEAFQLLQRDITQRRETGEGEIDFLRVAEPFTPEGALAPFLEPGAAGDLSPSAAKEAVKRALAQQGIVSEPALIEDEEARKAYEAVLDRMTAQVLADARTAAASGESPVDAALRTVQAQAQAFVPQMQAVLQAGLDEEAAEQAEKAAEARSKQVQELLGSEPARMSRIQQQLVEQGIPSDVVRNLAETGQLQGISDRLMEAIAQHPNPESFNESVFIQRQAAGTVQGLGLPVPALGGPPAEAFAAEAAVGVGSSAVFPGPEQAAADRRESVAQFFRERDEAKRAQAAQFLQRGDLDEDLISQLLLGATQGRPAAESQALLQFLSREVPGRLEEGLISQLASILPFGKGVGTFFNPLPQQADVLPGATREAVAGLLPQLTGLFEQLPSTEITRQRATAQAQSEQRAEEARVRAERARTQSEADRARIQQERAVAERRRRLTRGQTIIRS